MLRSLTHCCRPKLVLARLSTAAVGPSPTTTILLRHLSPNVTEKTLAEAIKDVRTRKIALEPGCSVHFVSEPEATYASSLIEKESKGKAVISTTSMPSLLLQNLPDTVSVEKLQSSFGKLEPKYIRIFGGQSFQVAFKTSKDALVASKAIAEISLGDRKLTAYPVRLGDDSFAVVVGNVGSNVAAEDVKKALAAAAPTGEVSRIDATTKTAVLRFGSSSEKEQSAVLDALKKVTLGGKPVKVSEPTLLKKPALFIRNVRAIGEKQLQTLLEGHEGIDRLQLNKRTNDMVADLAVAYFSSEEAAFASLSKLKSVRIDGKKIPVSYREAAEPAVTVSNLPTNSNEGFVKDLFSGYTPVRIELIPKPKGEHKRQALVVMGGLEDVALATTGLNNKTFGGCVVQVTETPVHDFGVEISGIDANVDELLAALTAAGVTQKPKAVSLQTNISASLAFIETNKAVEAYESFLNGSVSIAATATTTTGGGAGSTVGGLVAARVSVHPSYVVEVTGLSTDTPAAEIASLISSEQLANPLQIDRSAVLKLARHLEVVPALKKLRGIKVDDKALQATRYRPVLRDGDNAIDEQDGEAEEFEKFSIRLLTRDYMYAEPATRYQIAKNYFERSVTDAQVLNDVGVLLGTSVTDEMREEAKTLLATKPLTPAASQRLFQLYIQRDDMLAFSRDFREMTTLLGEPDEDDLFDWTQFKIDGWEDIVKLKAAMKRVEAAEVAKTRAKTAGGISGIDAASATADAAAGAAAGAGAAGGAAGTGGSGGEKVIVLRDDDGKETKVSLEDPSQLQDKDGRLWSGAILDTDTVQKTMPGNRVLSHRALVVVGNMRGAAGFGMGKGKTGGDAINAAFRDALRNLQFIDLYDKFGLAHDLHGKHNSCHAYIRATPRSRMMVASPFATAILTRFGVGTASVKLVGRRDPYAMCRAIFNALQQHENIEEFAKDRGKRYLTLKWIYENNV